MVSLIPPEIPRTVAPDVVAGPDILPAVPTSRPAESVALAPIAYDKSKVVRVAANAVESSTPETFRLKQTTIDTLAKSLTRQYLIFKEMSAANPPVRLDKWQEAFIADFETHATLGDDAQVDQRAHEYLTRPDRLVVALKQMEWMQATLQMATGAMFTRDNAHPENSKVVFYRGGQFFSGGREVGTGVVGKTIKLVKSVKQEKEPDEKVKVDLTGADTGRSIDKNQAEFLRRYLKDKDTLEPKDRQAVADILEKMNSARVDMYEATGYPINKLFKKLQLNLVGLHQWKRKGRLGFNFTLNYRINSTDPHFLIDTVSAPQAVARGLTGIKANLLHDNVEWSNKKRARQLEEAYLGVVKTETEKEIEKANALENKERAASIIAGKITELSAPKLTPEEEARQKKVVRAVEIIDSQDKVQEEADGIIAVVGKETLGKDVQGGSVYESRQTISEGLLEIKALEDRRSNLEQTRAEIFKNLSKFRTTETITSQLDILNQELREIKEAIETERSAVRAAEREVSRYERETQPYKVLIAKFREFEMNRINALAELASLAKNLGVPITEAEKKQSFLEQSPITPADEHERERQLAAYDVLGKEIALPEKLEDIMRRAHKLEHVENLSSYDRRYAAYPPAYLRAMQILFGEDIVLTQKKADFDRCAKLLSLTVFNRYIFQGIVTNTGNKPHDIKPAEITAVVVDSFIENIIADATKGNLMVMTATEKELYEKFLAIPENKKHAKYVDEMLILAQTTPSFNPDSPVAWSNVADTTMGRLFGA